MVKCGGSCGCSPAQPDHRVLAMTQELVLYETVADSISGMISVATLPPGNEELRRQIARKSLDLGCNLAAADVVVTHGCMEALNLCVRAVARPGDTIALESPTYFGLLQILESMGVKALEIPTHPRVGISLEALEFALERSKIAAVIAMPNAQNPLGFTMSDENKKRLVKILGKTAVPRIEG